MGIGEGTIAALRRTGAIRSRAVETAFLSVDPAPFIPEPLRSLSGADAPVPYDPDFAQVAPSPQALAVMLESLELASGVSVAVVGGGGYGAALASSVTSGAAVLLVEPNPTARGRVAQALPSLGSIRVSEALEGSWDRIWFPLPESAPAPHDAHLSELGFSIARTETASGPAIVKRIRSEGEFVELTADAVPRTSMGGGFDLRRCLAVDGFMVRAWQGLSRGPEDERFAASVSETLEGGPLDPETTPPTPQTAGARKAFHVAFIAQSAGDLDRAVDLYERSIALSPSAEAYTFLGWTHSFEGRYDAAMDACRRAILVDPTFGNPYNDIGAYLLELERPEEAIPWLEKTFAASRYCCPFYAHTNLARALLSLGRSQQARRHLIEALKANPDYEPAREMLRRIDPAFDYFA